MGRLVACLMANGIDWLPETKEQWRAAEILFFTNPKPKKRPGRPPEDEAIWYWSLIFMALLLVCGLAKTRNKPSISKAAELASDCLGTIQPRKDGLDHDTRTLIKRWNSKKNKFRGMLKGYVREEQPEWFELCRKQIARDIAIWQVAFGRNFNTLIELDEDE